MIVIKKTFLGMFAVLLLFTCSVMANAQSNTNFYTNSNGVSLTEEQYNYLINYFSESTLYTMTAEQLNFVKNEANLNVETKTVYIRTDEYFDALGNLIDSIETEVSEGEALNYEKEASPFA